MFKSRNNFTPSVGTPAVYDQFATFGRVLSTMYADPAEPERYDIIKLYGHTLSRYATEIGELCGYEDKAHFSENDLYEFYYDSWLDEWGLFNISKWHRQEQERPKIVRCSYRTTRLPLDGEFVMNAPDEQPE